MSVAAAKAGTAVARRWAEMLRDSGVDGGVRDAAWWGERLLAAIDSRGRDCLDYLCHVLSYKSLSSLARVEALVERGRIHYLIGQEALALDDLAEAIRTDPNISRAWEHRADAETTPSSIDVEAYLDTNDGTIGQRVAAAVDELAGLLGYEGPVNERTLDGSIWRRAKAVLRGAANLLLVKFDGIDGPVLLSRILSPVEIRALEEYPEMQTNPSRALESPALAVTAIDSGAKHTDAKST